MGSRRITAIQPCLWWKRLVWFQISGAETQTQCEARALVRPMARDRQSHLHFLVLSRRVMKAEVLTSDKDPSPPSQDMFHQVPCAEKSMVKTGTSKILHLEGTGAPSCSQTGARRGLASLARGKQM